MTAVVIFVLLLVNGLYVAAEFALIASRPSRLQKFEEEGHPLAASLLAITRSPRRLDAYFSTSQVGITLASLGLAMYGEASLSGAIVEAAPAGWGEHTAHVLGWLVALGILTYLHIVLGEMVPKTVALANPEGTAFRVGVFMSLSRVLFWPVVVPLAWSGRTILKLLRIPNPGAHERIFSADELGMVIEQSTAGGLLAEGSGRLLLAIFDFGEHSVADIMTPAAEVEALEASTPMAELPGILADSHHHRFPVFEGTLDHVVGILFVKDVLHASQSGLRPRSLRPLLRAPVVVPPEMPVEELLSAFRQARTRTAVVRSAEGRTVGLVTLDDVAEAVVGEPTTGAATE